MRIENGTLTTQRPIQGGGATDCTSPRAMANIFAVTARRNLLSEWFFIEQGKIRSIYAVMHYPEPDAMAPNWPPFDGNWPVR